ncbi:hypothetical protein NSQ26_12410 [Bacillus sp. FSL W7-1360]
MSWLLHLCETYDSNASQVGKFDRRRGGQWFTLLPVSHTTQNVQVEVLVREDGSFHSANAWIEIITAPPDCSTVSMSHSS